MRRGSVLSYKTFNAGSRLPMQISSRFKKLNSQPRQSPGSLVSSPPPRRRPADNRTRSRRGGGGANGGDVALYLRAGLQYAALTCPLVHPTDDTTKVCGVHLLGDRPLTIVNLYRPPIRPTELDTYPD